MKQKPFRITIEHWDQKVSVEVDHSEVSIEEVFDMLQQVLLGAGWHPDQVKQILNIDEDE